MWGVSCKRRLWQSFCVECRMRNNSSVHNYTGDVSQLLPVDTFLTHPMAWRQCRSSVVKSAIFVSYGNSRRRGRRAGLTSGRTRWIRIGTGSHIVCIPDVCNDCLSVCNLARFLWCSCWTDRRPERGHHLRTRKHHFVVYVIWKR